MVYPGQFHRLVMIGTLYGDTFNMTLNIVPSALGELGMPAVGPGTLSGVATDVSTWFGGTEGPTGGPGFLTSVKLTSIKLNRVGPDGRYVDDDTMEHTYPSPISGTSGGAFPPQLATAITLRTALSRGRGSKGRFYLPPTSTMGGVGADGRISPAFALLLAGSTRTLINSLNTRYALIGRVGVASNIGTGRFEHVTDISCGRVVDTIRSRRSALDEDYQTLPIP